MARNTTYSFKDVKASIVGPGGGFQLADGAGAAEEGITVSQAAEIDEMTIGADGSGMHSLVANKAGRVTVRLLKTSPVNALLATMAAFQRTSGINHGQNTISIVNKVSGDAITCQLAAFAKIPDINYAKAGGTIEWEFNSIQIDVALGAGVQ